MQLLYISLLLLIMLCFTCFDFLNYQKVSKYYELDRLQNFLLLFMSLLTALIVKNSHILAGIYVIFLKRRPRPNLKGFQYQLWTLEKRSKKWLSNKTTVSAFLQISCSNLRLKLCQRPQNYKNCQSNQI